MQYETPFKEDTGELFLEAMILRVQKSFFTCKNLHSIRETSKLLQYGKNEGNIDENKQKERWKPKNYI